tara:strand:- start:1488 stop:1691 length:204 start_codon:yes stop_codon:yes gene_type:complete
MAIIANVYDVEDVSLVKENNITDTRPLSYCNSYCKINDTYNKWSVVFLFLFLFGGLVTIIIYGLKII